MNDIRDRLVESVRRRFGDEDLAQAAYHCIADADCDPSQLGKVPAEILQQLDLFKTLDATDEHPEHRIAMRIVPGLKFPEAAALFLLRELNLACDHDQFGAWTREFVTTPFPLPSMVRRSVRRVDTKALNRIIAPLARFWGDWESYRVARCVALWIEEPKRFEEIVEFAQANGRPDGWCARYVQQIAALLEDAPEAGKPTWEWHHVETISSNLRALGGKRDVRHLALCGYVTVPCASALACYEALSRLHAKAGHMQHEFRDLMGASGRLLYRAIHTMLEVEFPGSPKKPHRAAIKVRLLPAQESGSRHAPMNLIRMHEIFGRLKGEADTIGVFTRGMEEMRLAAGATVLDFAYAISRRLIGRIESALVNGSPVDENHPLEAGDNIELVKVADGEFRNLPPEWARDRTAHGAKRIRSAWQANLRAVLRNRGRVWIQQRLISLCGVRLSKQAAHGVLEATLAQLAHAQRRGGDTRSHLRSLRHGIAWWLAELGTHAAAREGIYWDDLRRGLSEDDLCRLESDIRQTMEWIQTGQTVADFVPDGGGNLVYRGIIVCDCLQSGGPIGISSRKGTAVVLHAVRSQCASEPVDGPQVRDDIEFIITAHNRVGIARDICDVFNLAKASIDAISAKSRQGAESVIRVRLSTQYADDAALVADLERLAGVVKVHAPRSGSHTELKRVVPITSSDRRHAPIPPFTCGPPVEQPEHFYGRDREIGALHAWAEAARRSVKGTLASIRGPHRSGKSSIVLHWIQQLHAGGSAIAGAYQEATQHDTWQGLHGRLLRHVRSSARALLGVDGDQLQGDGLHAILARLRQAPHLSNPLIVLAIDEAPALMRQTTPDPAQRQAFIAFVEEVRQTPGLMLITVGPNLPFDTLPEVYQDLFHDVHQVVVGPFTEAVTYDLLSARRSTRIYPAQVLREVALRVHDWAEGDACFATAIVHQMYDAAFNRFGAPVLELHAVKPAVNAAISQRGEMFVNRLRAAAAHCRSADLDADLVLRIIRRCMEDWERNRGSVNDGERLQRYRPYLTMHQLAALAESAAEDEVQRVIRVLARAGVINRLNLRTGKIVSMTPILAEYISSQTSSTRRLFAARVDP